MIQNRPARLWFLLFALGISFPPHPAGAGDQAAGLSLRWITSAVPVRVELGGLTHRAIQALRDVSWDRSRWEKLLTVSVLPARPPGTNVVLPTMAGVYEIAASSLRFIPQFSPIPGVRYQ